MSIIHQLSIGHLDSKAITERREIIVEHALDMSIVRSIIASLDGDYSEVQFLDGYIVTPWLFWANVNTDCERLALILAEEHGCILADVQNASLVDPGELTINQEPSA